MSAKTAAAFVLIFALFAVSLRANVPAHREKLLTAQLENMAYKVEGATNGVAILRDGKFQDKPVEPGAATRLEVDLVGPVAHGDLTGNGSSDAVVVLAIAPGGSGTFIQLAAVLNEKGGPRHIASVDLGDRVKVLHLEVRDQVVTVNLLTQGPNDPMSDPKQFESNSYKLVNDKLVKANGN